MADFFIGVPHDLVLFGPLHIGISVVLVCLALTLFFMRRRIASFGYFKLIRYIMAGILLSNMAVHYISKIVLGIWRFDTDLPLHLCFITNFLMIYILITDNKRQLYRIVYFFTFIGPLPAMIWPDLRYSYDSYTFYQFLISHHLMILFSLYCLFVLNYKVKLRHAFPAILIGNVYVGLMYAFNTIFETNYVMMEELPAQLYEVYPFLHALPPLFWLELVGILAVFASYIPAGIRNQNIKKLSENNPSENIEYNDNISQKE